MSVILVCLGGLVGMLAAVAMLVAGQTIMVALAVWSVSGILVACLALTLALFPRREPAPVAERV